MSKGMYTCKVCGRDFALIAEERYTARDIEKTGALACLTTHDEAKGYDAFDCPHCGCQNIVQERKWPVCEIRAENEESGEGEEGEGEGEGEEVATHDGCLGCVHEGTNGMHWPCNSCKQSFMDYYQVGGEESHE